MKKLTELAEWQALCMHKKTIADAHMQDWFNQHSQRFKECSLKLEGILLDYSKNRVTTETLNRLIQLANAAHLKEKITAFMAGDVVNHSERRAALHTALRAHETKTILHNGKNIMPMIHAALKKMREFTEKIRNKTRRGVTGKPIRVIVNIGIGGSHLGPLMAVHALKNDAKTDLAAYFISNIDSAHLQEVLTQIDPETTLFIVSSKSFTTLETLTNAKTLRQWLIQQLGPKALQKQFVAVTAAYDAAIAFGILEENIFTLWDWVGGRYSLWSAMGLPLALMIGMDSFLDFLAGARAMDEHFEKAPFSHNMPVILALLGIWYINFFDARHHAVVPYSHHLNYFRAYLQQLDMESNGKSISQEGLAIDFLTGPVILGEQGCNGQHAFHQLLHQGRHFIPVDFILVGADDHADADDPVYTDHHDILISSALSQAQALMCGKPFHEAFLELQAKGHSKEESQRLAQHKAAPGNRPSTILFLDKMTPYNLGMLLALYEHKTFVQGAIWDINSFDQWGVELGKTLLPSILKQLHTHETSYPSDSSTQGLIQHYKQLKRRRHETINDA
jgi:glucose-6-phosphate isomerase